MKLTEVTILFAFFFFLLNVRIKPQYYIRKTYRFAQNFFSNLEICFFFFRR